MSEKRSAVLSRSIDGRWIGGVCAGLARGRALGPGWFRVAFVVAALLGGFGILAYLSCWLIIPGEDESADGAGWLTVLALGAAVVLGVLALAAVSATATLFGFGWIVVGLAAVVLVIVLTWWPRLGAAWAMLPIVALTGPSLAVAAGGLRLAPVIGHTTVAPRALAAAERLTVRAGLGTLLVDLRHTELPAGGEMTLRIDGGVSRTIVALPANRCVHVALAYDAQPFFAQMAGQLTGRLPFSGVEVFGEIMRPWSGYSAFAGGPRSGPSLRIDVTSAGGSLYVRDYPDDVDPDLSPDWPGYRVILEPRPDTRGVPRRAAARLIAGWRARLRGERRSQRLVDSLMPGPCADRGGAR